MKKHVLVTGSEGFIGRHTVEGLTAAGHEVVGADRVPGAPYRADLSDRRSADLIASTIRPDFIVHLAASCTTPGSMTSPLKTFQDTVVAGANVMDMARRWSVPIVVVSSVKARDGRTPYGAAKHMVEVWAEECREAFGIPTIIVRPGTVYGPGQEGSPESGWIAWFLKAKSQGITVTIDGDGSQTRDLLHVRDMVTLFQKMVADPSRYVGRTWDVGGGVKNAVTVEQMAQFLGLEYTFGPPRYGDSGSYIGKNDAPDWEPRIDWRDGIRRLM